METKNVTLAACMHFEQKVHETENLKSDHNSITKCIVGLKLVLMILFCRSIQKVKVKKPLIF